MEAIELHYESHDGVSDIRALLWQRDAASCEAPRGIVQIVHGMSEHVEPLRSFRVVPGFKGFRRLRKRPRWPWEERFG